MNKDQNKSLRSLIPKHWYDRDDIMEIMIVACFKEWVEKEDGLWPRIKMMENTLRKKKKGEPVEDHVVSYCQSLPRYKRLAKIYKWLISNDWQNIPCYSEREKIFNRYILDIVRYRGYLWT